MLQQLKRFSWLGLLALGAQMASGFALLGPNNEAYQVPTIGYNPLPGDRLPTGPKNLGEEYRRNTPVMYYACDANFLDFFGLLGMAEVDKAFAVYNSLDKVSNYSNELTEFPQASRRKNWKAEALTMIDLKSVIMTLIVEQLGLAEPERYTWGLHDRYLPAGATCPFGEEYLIIKRNFDPVIGSASDQLKYSSYVNGILYTYQIVELCAPPLPPPAQAVAFSTDPDADQYNAVASSFGGGNAVFFFSPYGTFFTGLTRDDVGGLRYLLRANNMNVESAGPNTLTEVTNRTPQVLFTSNLTEFASQALTNAPAALQAIYPALTILTSSNYFVNVPITNTTAYFTNYPWDPFGAPAHLAFATNVTITVQARYVDTFANLIVFKPIPGGWTTTPVVSIPAVPSRAFVTIQTTTVGVSNNPYAPAGSTNVIATNITAVTFQTNAILGEYFILPTNLCDIAIIASQLTNVLTATNPISVATNLLVNPNPTGNPAGTTLTFAQDLITYATNHAFIIFPVICTPTNVSLMQGIEKITFIRRDYDSLLTRTFNPITSEYTLTSVTNFQTVTQHVRRTVSDVDFLMTALDMTAGPGALPDYNIWARNISFNTNSEYVGLAGPGTLESRSGVGAPGNTFFFNKIGPLFYNLGLVDTNAFLTEVTQIPVWLWGSFDGSTNTPVVYPNDLSIGELENQVLIQVTPTYLLDGKVGTAYYGTLQTLGSTPNWQAPFYWSLAPGSPGLPPGLFIATAGDGSGLIYGTPEQSGFFDIIIRVSDAQGRTVDRSNAIRINP